MKSAAAWWRELVLGVCVLSCAAAVAGAVDVRDRVAGCEASARQTGAVKQAEDKAAAEWRDEVRHDLRAIKNRLGVLP